MLRGIHTYQSPGVAGIRQSCSYLPFHRAAALALDPAGKPAMLEADDHPKEEATPFGDVPNRWLSR